MLKRQYAAFQSKSFASRFALPPNPGTILRHFDSPTDPSAPERLRILDEFIEDEQQYQLEITQMISKLDAAAVHGPDTSEGLASISKALANVISATKDVQSSIKDNPKNLGIINVIESIRESYDHYIENFHLFRATVAQSIQKYPILSLDLNVRPFDF
eukprot:jgi/Hompol1/3535/HPOL_003271-RA